MHAKSFAGCIRTVRAAGPVSGMRFGRQKAEAVKTRQSTLEQVYSLAKSTFQVRKDVFPSEVERLKDLLCEPPYRLQSSPYFLLCREAPFECLGQSAPRKERVQKLIKSANCSYNSTSRDGLGGSIDKHRRGDLSSWFRSHHCRLTLLLYI